MSDRPDPLDVLLSRGKLGGRTREQVLERALRQANVTRPWFKSPVVLWGSPAVAAAAIVALLSLNLVTPRDGMTSKGNAAGGVASVSIDCTKGDGERCPRDGTLLFRVEGVTRPVHLTAYADPIGGGERIWFFPMTDGSEPEVLPQEEPVLLRQGIKLRSLPPGRYEVEVVISERSLSRAEVLAARDVLLSKRVTLEVEP